ncbi:MAG: hypothetical protein II920_04415 [Clostridia bacterium]|nr:hypothetical protein [Clostridia bacterium]
MDNKQQVLDALECMGINYEMCSHAPVNSIDDCRAAEEQLHALMPRNVFLCTTNQKHFALLLIRPKVPFRTSLISKQAGMSRLSFAPESEIKRLLGTYPGAVSPLGLIYDAQHEVKLIMDRALLNEESLLFHPLDNACSLKINTEAFTQRFIARLGYEINLVDT